jgi:hypothetical protein
MSQLTGNFGGFGAGAGGGAGGRTGGGRSLVSRLAGLVVILLLLGALLVIVPLVLVIVLAVLLIKWVASAAIALVMLPLGWLARRSSVQAQVGARGRGVIDEPGEGRRNVRVRR